MNAIVAVGSDYGIGRDNDLIFNIPEDKKFFRSMTAGKTVVMATSKPEYFAKQIAEHYGFADRDFSL